MSGLNLLFMGPPGVGKGTQAARLAEKFGIPHISTGEMFRRAIQAQTPMGRKAKPYVDGGQYVPDEIVNGIVAERLGEDDCARGFILDGYPRTIGQAEAFDRMLQDEGKALTAVLYLQVPDEVVLERLTGRRVCTSCGAVYHLVFDPPQQPDRCDRCGGALTQRSDDREETVRERLAVYRRQTAPLIEHYRARGLLVEIDGQGAIDEVTARIEAALAAGGAIR